MLLVVSLIEIVRIYKQPFCERNNKLVLGSLCPKPKKNRILQYKLLTYYLWDRCCTTG